MNGIIAMESRMQRKLHVRFGGGNRADSRSSTTPTQLDEQSGPVEANCPRSILELLTSSSHPYALDWRNRCYAMLRLKERNVADGDILRLPEPLRFTDGSEHREFRVSKRGSKIELRTPDGFGAYRISRLMERRFEIIRPARRIKTFFPIAQ